MKYLSGFIMICLLFACTNESGNIDVTEDTMSTSKTADTTFQDPGTVQSKPDGTDCYLRVNGRDSIRLKLNTKGGEVSGEIEFDNYQYDSSSGKVEGKKQGDKIFLWYSFEAEGMHSVMQLVFRQSGNDLIRATGDVVNRGDTVLFKNTEQLSFDASNTLKQVPCD